MSDPTLQQRVELLEKQMAELRAELRLAKGKRVKDWRRTIGAFTDDEGMKEVFQEALRLREEDRQKVLGAEDNGK